MATELLGKAYAWRHGAPRKSHRVFVPFLQNLSHNPRAQQQLGQERQNAFSEEWDRLESQLVQWEQHPDEVEDEGLEPPNQETIPLIREVCRALRAIPCGRFAAAFEGSQDGRIRNRSVSICQQPIGDAALLAFFNGTRIEPTEELGPPFEYPYDRLLGGNEHRRAWNCASDLLRDETNTVRIALDDATGSIMPVWLDLAIA
jgi:hypothetical protein